MGEAYDALAPSSDARGLWRFGPGKDDELFVIKLTKVNAESTFGVTRVPELCFDIRRNVGATKQSAGELNGERMVDPNSLHASIKPTTDGCSSFVVVIKSGVVVVTELKVANEEAGKSFLEKAPALLGHNLVPVDFPPGLLPKH